MAKKCVICEGEAEYRVKDNPDYYCEECAIEHFGDLSYLQKIDGEQLKSLIKERMNSDEH